VFKGAEKALKLKRKLTKPKKFLSVHVHENFRKPQSFQRLYTFKLSVLELREKIADSTTALFLRYGIKSVTMDDIAKELSISKKTIYQYFKDKNDIVVTIAKRHFAAEQKDVTQLFKDCPNAIARLHRLSRHMREGMAELNPSLLYDLQKYHPKAWQLFIDFKHSFMHSAMRETMELGKTEGNFRADIDPDVMATLRLEQIEMSLNTGLFPRDRFDFRDVQVQLLDHFIQGILTDQGRELFQSYLQTNAA